MPLLEPGTLATAKLAEINTAMKKDLQLAATRFRGKQLSFVAAQDVSLSDGKKTSLLVVTPKPADALKWVAAVKKAKAPVWGQGTCLLLGDKPTNIQVKVLKAKDAPPAKINFIIERLGKVVVPGLRPAKAAAAKGVPGLTTAYLAAVKNSQGLTSALPNETAAISRAEKAGEKATLRAAVAALQKHKADAAKARGADPKKVKTFQTALDAIAKKITAAAR
jgi:hypothetical protein